VLKVLSCSSTSHNFITCKLMQMSPEDFIRNNRGIDDGKDLPEEFSNNQQVLTKFLGWITFSTLSYASEVHPWRQVMTSLSICRSNLKKRPACPSKLY
jgi:hypothetical protein